MIVADFRKVSETIHVLLGLNNILYYSLLTNVPLFGTVTRFMHIDIFLYNTRVRVDFWVLKKLYLIPSFIYNFAKNLK